MKVSSQLLAEAQRCPSCGEALASAPGFVTWCPECEWNVDPSPPAKLNWRERRAAKASAKASRRLFERISATDVSGPPPRVAAITLLALLVHLLTLATFLAGVWFVVYGFGLPWPIRIPFGALLIGVAAMVQPFWSMRKSKLKPLTRDRAPLLFGLVDEEVAALGCKGLDGIAFNWEVNASIGHSRRRGWVMTIGIGLWTVLSPQERVAVIAHELAHQLNRDQRNGMVVHGAAFSMGRWAYLLTPITHEVPARGVAGLAEMILPVFLFPLVLAAQALEWSLSVLAARQGLSAEYYADVLASRVAGTDAAVTGLEKLLLATACHHQLIHTAKFDKSADPWVELARYAAAIPAHEMERQRRLGRLRLPAIDTSHPPTQLRADLVRKLPYRDAQVVLDPERSAAIDRELAGVVASVTKYLRSLYPR
jgi:Peptidase family M48